MLLILIKGKLIHTDNILPILAALRKAKFNKNITLIYPSKHDLSTIKSNKELYITLQRLAVIKSFYVSDDLKNKIPYFLAGVISIIHRNIIMLPLLFKKIIVLRIENIPKINWIIYLNKKIHGGKEVALFLHPYTYEYYQIFLKRVLQIHGTNVKPYIKIFNKKNDLVISSYSKSELANINEVIIKKSTNVFHIGSILNWPSWKKLIEYESKNAISKLPKKFIFYPLSILQRVDLVDNNNKFSVVDSFMKIIKTIRECDKDIYIIFRPHPTSDMQQLYNLLDSAKLKNYKISYINPSILIDKCMFVVTHATSTLDIRIWEARKFLIRFLYPRLSIFIKEEVMATRKFQKEYNFVNVFKISDLKNKISSGLLNQNNKIINNNEQNNLKEKKIIKKLLKVLNNL